MDCSLTDSLTDALHAERLAASLRDPSAFCASRTHVTAAELDAYTWMRAERIRIAISGSAADVQRAVEDVATRWRGADAINKPVRVVSLLAAHSKRLLRVHGREMLLEVNRNKPAREILSWRYVSLALPPAILIAAATQLGTLPATAVRVLHPSIAPDGEVAQQHVHHAAMLSFERVWVNLRLRVLHDMTGFMESMRLPRAFCPGLHRGFCIGGRGVEERKAAERFPFMRAKHLSEWGEVLRLAFIARGILERHTGHPQSLSVCDKCATPLADVSDLANGRSHLYLQADRVYPWPDELVSLGRKQRRARARRGVPGSDESSFMRGLEVDEAMLLARAFRYIGMTEAESLDWHYERLFLQYLRVKSAVFGLLVHPPGEPGLKNFLDHFLQIKVYAPEAESAIPSCPDEPGLRVCATEYRVAPDAWFEACRRQDIEHPHFSAKTLEAAWLIHFKREPPPADRIPLHITAVRKMESEAHQIAGKLEAEPTRLRSLRGIDICGVEEVQPCWVVADTLRRLRRRSQEIAGRDPRLKLEPLRLTLHAGEDFQWLTSGVRAIAEPFIWKLVERGDRIGHGIALTIDPSKWWSRRSRDVVQVKRFDRLLDLAFLAEYVEHPTRDQVAWLRHATTRIVRDLRLEPDLERKPSVTIDIDVVDTAKRLWRTLGSRQTRTLMETSTWRLDDTRRHETWIHRYLWTPSIQKLAGEDVHMRLEDDRNDLSMDSDRNERDLLIEARNRLIREVARWQVCIEANPSSNLIVGGLDGMSAQDHLHARATEIARTEGKETLTWTISTDDPITFSTTLADEYAYAWAGMVLRGENSIDPSYARGVLDEAAATSMRTRFTIPSDESELEQNRRRPTGSRRH